MGGGAGDGRRRRMGCKSDLIEALLHRLLLLDVGDVALQHLKLSFDGRDDGVGIGDRPLDPGNFVDQLFDTGIRRGAANVVVQGLDPLLEAIQPSLKPAIDNAEQHVDDDAGGSQNRPDNGEQLWPSKAADDDILIPARCIYRHSLLPLIVASPALERAGQLQCGGQ